jgi:hypothetical protein
LARQNVAGSGRVRNRRPTPAMLRRQAEPASSAVRVAVATFPVIPALAGTTLLEGLKRGQNPASVLIWTFRNRPSKPRRFRRSRQRHEPQSSRTRLPGSARRAADVIMDSGRLSGKPPCGRSLRARGAPSLQPKGLGFIRPARPSKRASVAVWGASGARRPLRKPHRRASGSSSARAHEAAQKPPAHRSSGVP